MKRFVLFSIPTPQILTEISKFLFYKPNTIFGYMPSDGASKDNAQYTPIWENLCKQNNAKLIYINNTNPNDLGLIAGCDTLMITGGNTFQLLHNLRTFGFDKEIENFTKKEDFVISGFSAGAVVLTPTIKIVKEGWAFGPDENLIGLTNLTALKLLDFEVLPHFNSDKDNSLLSKYRENTRYSVKTISDNEFIIEDLKSQVDHIAESNSIEYTPYPLINAYLKEYQKLIVELLGNNLVSVYLTGSLTYGDYNPDRSDIDLHVITKLKIDANDLIKLEQIHKTLEESNPAFKDKVEASYTPTYLFKEILPPKEPRPWYGFGKLYKEAPYGNEWIINNYILQEHGTPLYGESFSDLFSKISIDDVKKACTKDFYKEWLPKTDKDIASLDDSHIQSYVVLNLCRILYTVRNSKIGSKTTSSNWVKINLFPQYEDLITLAQQWKYGEDMKAKERVIRFILDSQANLENFKLSC